MGVEGQEPSLLKLYDDSMGNFIRFIGTMVQHADRIRTGPCPLCGTQEDQHDYATCLRTATIRLKGGQLNIMTGRGHRGDLPLDLDRPVPNPNPLGPTPSMTPRTIQSLQGPVPTGDTPRQDPSSSKGKVMEGRYTCYAQPCTNCTDPFPMHITPECKEATNPNVGLRLMWSCLTHLGIQMLGQAHRWNSQLTTAEEACDVCGTELEDHDLQTCILKARIRVDLAG